MSLLELKDYRAHFHTRRGIVKAVDGLSFTLQKGETLGIVGESGSGKTVSQLSYLRLLPEPPLRIVGGDVRFKGSSLLSLAPNELRKVRGNRISFIFQEPMTSLNPYLKIGTQLIEPLQIHRQLSKKEATTKATQFLERVQINRPARAMNSYPHEFSGGMRQRVLIAMALTTEPDLLIADEPTTALDVTVQSEILQLLRDLQRDFGMAILLITHDLGVVASLAHRVLVLYAGKVMEEGRCEEIFDRSRHPYTRALLKSTPRIDAARATLEAIPGTPPDLTQLGAGCPFFDRCSVRLEVCQQSFPEEKGDRALRSYCHAEL